MNFIVVKMEEWGMLFVVMSGAEAAAGTTLYVVSSCSLNEATNRAHVKKGWPDYDHS